MTRKAASAAYTRAVREFAKNWSDFGSSETSAEDAAPDAALGFFDQYPWQEWAAVLGLRRSDMQSNVADYVYDAMRKGTRKNAGSARRAADKV
jgi:hypothetical protein